VAGYLESAELAGADYIMVTCSSIGPAVEAGAKLIGVPVLRVDQPMADQAVRTGSRVGVIATLRTTLEPTADLISRRAAVAGKRVEITAKLAEGAFEALMSGDAAKHDTMVAAALKDLSKQVDVIVLAQASMARVVDTLAPEDKRVPILASPGIAVEYLAREAGLGS
jgi:Asp/Glu/hydantoin racemase